MPDQAEHSREEWEVTGGKLHHLNEKAERVTLTKGARFRPTIRQAENGSLKGKARKVKAGSRYVGAVVTRNIGLRTLEWGHPAALKKALDTSPMLTVEEMQAVGATGATGFVTADVERALEARERQEGAPPDKAA